METRFGQPVTRWVGQIKVTLLSFSLIQYFVLQPLELVCSVRAPLAKFINFFQQSRYSDGVSIVNYVLNKKFLSFE